jgi:hypothetical protein
MLSPRPTILEFAIDGDAHVATLPHVATLWHGEDGTGLPRARVMSGMHEKLGSVSLHAWNA